MVVLSSKIAQIPSVIKAKDLAQILKVPINKVAVFARRNNFKFHKHSDLILDYKAASLMAIELGLTPEYIEFDLTRRDYWDSSNYDSKWPRRPMVVSVVGHVNHGKTTLLDVLRKTNIAADEPGGITQSLCAFSVQFDGNNNNEKNDNNKTITMIDTPGHKAFYLMRENGASVSDFLLVVIDAIEGIRPQTEESISIAQESNMPIIVAINKIDIARKNAVVDDENYSIKAVIEISALKKTNIDFLIKVLFQKADQIEEYLHPNPNDEKAEATVIESGTQKGLGRTLFAVVHWGYLTAGQWFVTDRFVSKIKCLYNDKGEKIKKSLPGQPVQIIGFDYQSHPPSAFLALIGMMDIAYYTHFTIPPNTIMLEKLKGSGLFVLPKTDAEKLQTHRENLVMFKVNEMRGMVYKENPNNTNNENEGEEEEEDNMGNFEKKEEKINIKEEEKRTELIEDEINKRSNNVNNIIDQQSDDKQSLAVILKSDNIGRLETLLGLCESIANEGDLDIKIIQSGVGDVTAFDLFHAQVEIEENNELFVPVLCFGKIGLDPNAKKWLQTKKNLESVSKISVHQFQVIYDLIDSLKEMVKTKKNMTTTNIE